MGMATSPCRTSCPYRTKTALSRWLRLVARPEIQAPADPRSSFQQRSVVAGASLQELRARLFVRRRQHPRSGELQPGQTFFRDLFAVVAGVLASEQEAPWPRASGQGVRRRARPRRLRRWQRRPRLQGCPARTRLARNGWRRRHHWASSGSWPESHLGLRGWGRLLSSWASRSGPWTRST